MACKPGSLPVLTTLHIVLGVLFLIAVTVDVVWTTLTLEHAGRLTRVATRAMGGGIARLERLSGWRWPRTMAGPATVLSGMLLWLLLAWVAWLAIFTAAPSAVLATDTKAQAELGERAYYVGYTMATLGTGDFVPGGTPWRLATIACAVHGFFLMTLAITYLVPIVSAVVGERRFAVNVTALGRSAEEIVTRGYDGSSFAPLLEPLGELGKELTQIDRQHAAYPVLHYYDAHRRDESMAVAVAVLDEVLAVLDAGVAPEKRPHAMALAALRHGLEQYRRTLGHAGIRPAETEPPAPRLRTLDPVPTVDAQTFRQAMRAASERRRQHLGHLEALGWTWTDLAPSRAP